VAVLTNITFACDNPVPLSEFWAAALGYQPVQPPPEVVAEVEKAIDRGELDPTGWAMLAHPDGTAPDSSFSDGRRARRRTFRSTST
jgi:hypothetical protein